MTRARACEDDPGRSIRAVSSCRATLICGPISARSPSTSLDRGEPTDNAFIESFKGKIPRRMPRRPLVHDPRRRPATWLCVPCLAEAFAEDGIIDFACIGVCNLPGNACCPVPCGGPFTCCGSGDNCFHSDLCCPGGIPVCKDTCCGEGVAGCASDGFCGCPNDEVVCGSNCCAPDNLCCGNQCFTKTADYECCGEAPCPPGNCQNGNICCPPGQPICKEGCCAGGKCDAAGNCCAPPAQLCGNQCCPPFNACCNSVCCEADQVCVAVDLCLVVQLRIAALVGIGGSEDCAVGAAGDSAYVNHRFHPSGRAALLNSP